MRPDLHTHTTASDGVLSPGELIAKAAALGVDMLALTDHDTFDGFLSLRETDLPIPVLQGTELSMADRKNMHLLCYGEMQDTPLHRKVRQLAENRISRAEQMMDLLDAHAMPLDREAVRRSAGGSIGRPHLARAMIQAGYVKNLNEAFDRFLADGKPCYVPGDRLYFREALTLARESGFIPVLAHPFEMGFGVHTLSQLLPEWKEQGLMGLEVYHPSAAAKGYAPLDSTARRLGLLVTGGSDFHQSGDRHGEPGCTAPFWPRAEEDVHLLLEAMHTANS